MTIHFTPIGSQYTVMGKIHAQSFAKAWSEATFRDMFEDSPQYNGWLILQDDQVAGFIICATVLEQAEIMTVCILPSHRGKGLGSALLNHQIQDLRQNQVKKLFLEVNEYNKNAIQLYNRLGFSADGIRKNYYKCVDGKFANALNFTLNL